MRRGGGGEWWGRGEDGGEDEAHPSRANKDSLVEPIKQYQYRRTNKVAPVNKVARLKSKDARKKQNRITVNKANQMKSRESLARM